MIAIIPARGNSKEVKRKNLAIVDGKPLLCHISDTLKTMGIRVVVSTEDSEVASVARVHGYEVHDRNPVLSADDVPVADVAQAVIEDLGYKGPVLIAQPTCPFVTKETLARLINLLGENETATLATPVRHILRNHHDRLVRPANRQYIMDNLWDEVGVRVFESGVPFDASPTAIIEVSDREAMDIDSIHDLHAAQHTPRTIEFRTTGNHRIGTGHVRRSLALANELQHHDITFTITEDSEEWVAEWVTDAGWKLRPFSYPGADLVIVDTLDTTTEEVARFKANGSKVITIEDLGLGARDADVVVNALYQKISWDYYRVSGPKWADLRPEFIGLPDYEITDEGRIMVMFGGTDPANLGQRIASLFHVTSWVKSDADVSVAWEMMNHDVLITSAGRTVYEAAAVGIPTIIIAQNSREATHSHLGNGNLYLGIGSVVTDEQITETVTRLLADKDLRRDLSETSRKSVDGKGLQRIAWAAEGLLRGM